MFSPPPPSSLRRRISEIIHSSPFSLANIPVLFSPPKVGVGKRAPFPAKATCWRFSFPLHFPQNRVFALMMKKRLLRTKRPCLPSREPTSVSFRPRCPTRQGPGIQHNRVRSILALLGWARIALPLFLFFPTGIEK